MLFAAAVPAAADDFYRGRTVDLYIGFGVGGTYDLYARAVAKHLGRHVAGDPTIVPRSMPGAGGLATANYMYKVAPHDGTALAVTSQTIGIDQLFHVSGVSYETREFLWIGRMTSAPTVFFTWHTSPTKTVADARTRETTMGSSGSGDTTDTPRALNSLAGTKFKPVLGYRGSNDVWLAVERGEVEGGYALFSDLKFRKADWLRDKQVNLLFTVANRRDPDFPDLPLSEEFASDETGKRILRLFAAPGGIGRSVFTTPGVPAERLAVLRRAFGETLTDPAFLEDAKRIGLELDPLSGEELQHYVETLMQTPADLVAKADAARRP
jgi:tripartite-type tricarboxylate transporter receptor subunit TctC